MSGRGGNDGRSFVRQPYRGGGGGGARGAAGSTANTPRSTGPGYIPRGGAGGSRGRGGFHAPASSAAQVSKMTLPHQVVSSTPAPYGWGHLPDVLQDIKLPVRKVMPKEAEKTVNLKVNHFPVTIKLPKNIARYHVTISRLPWDGAQETVRAPPKFLLAPLHKNLKEILGQEFAAKNKGKSLGIISDWSKTLYCTETLGSNSFMKEVEFVPAEGEDGRRETFGVKVLISDENVDTRGLQAAVDNMQGEPITPELEALDRIYNTLMKNLSCTRFTSVKSSLIKFAPNYGSKLGKGLMSFPGYDVNVDITNGWRPYLNILVANQATMMSGNVIDVLADFFGRRKEDCVSPNRWSEFEIADASRFLSGFKVKYTPAADRTFGGTVTRLSNRTISEETFSMTEEGGTERIISVYNYYIEKYGNTNLNPNGLCLILNQHTQVPAEICIVKEKQSVNRKLTGDQTNSMLKLAKKDPHKLQVEIEEAIADLELVNDPILAKFGFSIGANQGMLKMSKARVLAAPIICYGTVQAGQVATVKRFNGVWDNWRTGGSQFLEPANVSKWGVLITCKGYKGKDLTQFSDDFVRNVVTLAAQVGMIMDKDVQADDLSDRLIDSFRDKRQNKEALQKYFKAKKEDGYQLILVVVPSDGSDLYGHVKQSSELETGLLTQCVTADHFGRPNPSEIKNILLKLNNKLGGINHVVVSPPGALRFRLFEDPVLILGADVTHPPPAPRASRDDPGKSFAAVVSSIDRTGMRYMTQVKAQQRQGAGAAEVITNFDTMIKASLNRFRNETKVAPRKIIYFRDGVGDGQFKELLHTEMREIRAACSSLSDKYKPKITFITVQKRHKTRFFLQGSDGSIENAPPGTVVDSEIVHPTEMDSFLLSHKGILGTSRPTHYHVLWDDSDFSEDEIQQMTYYLCHMYTRCNRAVSIPAPTYYAHHAATRALVLAEGFSGTVEETTALLQRTEINDSNPMHFV